MHRPKQDQKRDDGCKSDQHERENAADPVQIRREGSRPAQHHEPARAKPEQVDAEADQHKGKGDFRNFHLKSDRGQFSSFH